MQAADGASDAPGAADLLYRRLTRLSHLTTLLDYAGGTQPKYVGIARPGTAVVTFPGGLPASASAVFVIQLLTYDGAGNVLAIQWANGTSTAYTAVWDQRASLAYS